jgi:hypothetical protein
LDLILGSGWEDLLELGVENCGLPADLLHALGLSPVKSIKMVI